MPRRYRPEKRKIEPDVRYHNVQVQSFINRVMRRGKKSTATSLVYDTFDLIEKDSKSIGVFRADVYNKMDFVSYAPLIFVSALTGQRVVKVLDLAEEVYANANKRIPTSQLNDFLGWLHETHPPISRNKMKIKIKYMVQNKSLPPTFLLFTHSKSPLSPAYRKFLKRLIRDQFDLVGSPIRLYLKRN